MKTFTILFLLIINSNFILNEDTNTDNSESLDMYVSDESESPISSIESNNTITNNTKTEKPKFVLIAFQNYTNQHNNITFEVLFRQFFYNDNDNDNNNPKYLNITLYIYNNTLRILEEEKKNIKCPINDEKTKKESSGKNIVFNCTTKTNFSNIKKISVDENFILFDENNTIFGSILSEYAKRNIEDIKTQNKTYDFWYLIKSKLEQDNKSFQVTGEILESFDERKVKLFLKDNSDKKEKQADCSIMNSFNTYILNCTPKEQIFNAFLNNVGGEISDNKILIVSMENETESVNINLKYDKKNSSGKQLSGGAIAAIVIGCVCGILAISIIIYILYKKSVKPPVDKNALSMYTSNENINNSQ